MVSSRWQKQNIYFRNLGVTGTLTLSILGGFILSYFGEGKIGEILGGIILAVGIGVTFILMNRNPNKMLRVLRVDVESAEWNLRKLLRDNSIRFLRRVDDDVYHYELPGYKLSMIVKPYIWHNLNVDSQRNLQPATLLMLGDLNEKNQIFAEKLADMIDELDTRLPHVWKEA